MRMPATVFAFVVLPLAAMTPVAPLAQTTLPVFTLPGARPAAGFAGTWTNITGQEGVIARVQVTRHGDAWFARLWGACASCDWGEQPLAWTNELTGDATRLRLTSPVWTQGLGAGRPGMTNVELVLAGPELELTYRSYAVSSSSPMRTTERFTLTEKAPADVRSVSGPAPGTESDIVAPRPIKRATPGYTGEAMRARVAGTVWVQGIVETDGTLSDIHVVRSLDQQFGLDEEALRAARQWRFAPGTKDGQPVRVVVTIEIEFRMGTELAWP